MEDIYGIEQTPSDLYRAGIYSSHEVNGMGVERMGTTVVASVFDGGVVLGADSRTTMGSYIASRISDKIEPIHERIFCLRTGVSAHTQTLARHVRHYLGSHAINEGRLPLVLTTARLFQQMSYANKDYLQAGILVGGWDPVHGPQVFEITLGGTLVSMPFAMSGSGSSYIYGYCDANWRSDFTLEECKDFVKKALSLAMSRDGSSGGVARLCVVTEQEVVREYVSQQELPYKQ